MSSASVFAREARSILTRTGGYLRGFTHSLQPYSGCEFSCAYCYVRELAVQRANPYGLPWSSWIAPKLNAPTLLRRDAERGCLDCARIFCSSATDPYTPLERKLRLTRGCLEVMTEHPPEALLLQTRSPLVVRDLDLLARIPRLWASMTLCTDDERVRRALEPNAPGTKTRLQALGRLRAAGIRTQAAVAPLLPCDPARLAEQLDPVVDRVVVDDFFRGDGAGGRRSRGALAQLRAMGFARWTEPGYADEAIDVLRRLLGEDRVLLSSEGFGAVGGVGSVAERPRALPRWTARDGSR
ncbi:MAG TPA: radical SAM protein [Myxococcota bacterium]|nr:radical SAM protein [Myxococcota bacterium]